MSRCVVDSVRLIHRKDLIDPDSEVAEDNPISQSIESESFDFRDKLHILSDSRMKIFVFLLLILMSSYWVPLGLTSKKKTIHYDE